MLLLRSRFDGVPAVRRLKLLGNFFDTDGDRDGCSDADTGAGGVTGLVDRTEMWIGSCLPSHRLSVSTLYFDDRVFPVSSDFVHSGSSGNSSRMVTDDGVGARPESLFHSSPDERDRGSTGSVRKAGCCSLGGMGGGATITAEIEEKGRLLLRKGFRGGGIRIGGAAGTVDSYRKATNESSLKGFSTGG